MSLEPPGNEGRFFKPSGWFDSMFRLFFCLWMGGFLFLLVGQWSKVNLIKAEVWRFFLLEWSHVFSECKTSQKICVLFLCLGPMQENIVSSGASRFPVRHFRDQNDTHPCLGWKRCRAMSGLRFLLSDLAHGHRQFHCLQNGHPFVEMGSIQNGHIVSKCHIYRKGAMAIR